MNTRIDITTALPLKLPCHRCDFETPKMEKFGWKPGKILDPSWHDWFARWQLAVEKGTEKPNPPTVPYYLDCPDCEGTGEKKATVEEFVSHHLTEYQLALLKAHNIKFSKETT